jgi:hypothetical protein
MFLLLPQGFIKVGQEILNYRPRAGQQRRSQRQARSFTAATPRTPAPEVVLAAMTVAVVRQNGHIADSGFKGLISMTDHAGTFLRASSCRNLSPSTVLASRSVLVVHFLTS